MSKKRKRLQTHQDATCICDIIPDTPVASTPKTPSSTTPSVTPVTTPQTEVQIIVEGKKLVFTNVITPKPQQTPGAEKTTRKRKRKRKSKSTPEVNNEIALPDTFAPVHKQLFEAFSDANNINTEKLLQAVKAALKRFPIKHVSKSKRRKKTVNNKSTKKHKLNPKSLLRGEGDRGQNRISMFVPKKYRNNPETGTPGRKYMYYTVTKGDKICCDEKGTLRPEFLTFFANYIHAATDTLSDSDMKKWIHDDWSFGQQHPVMDYIAQLFRRQQQSAPAESVPEVESAPTQSVTNGPEIMAGN